MTDKKLRRLNRRELLEMLLVTTEENEKLREQLRQALEELSDKQIQIEFAGSIAEAALQLNGVFEAADRAAKQYLENVRRITEGNEEA